MNQLKWGMRIGASAALLAAALGLSATAQAGEMFCKVQAGPLAEGGQLLSRAVRQIRSEQTQLLDQQTQTARAEFFDSVQVLAAGAPTPENGSIVTLE